METDKIAAKLTKSSGGLLDFFNIGGLAKQRTQESLLGLWNHYSWRELFIRSGIVATTIAFGLMAANTCEDNECSSISRGILGASTGFFISHAVAVWPTVQRRNKIKSDTQKSLCHIEDMLVVLSKKRNSESEYDALILPMIVNVRSTYQQALNLVLPVKKKGDAVHNLFTIKTLMRELEKKVEADTLALSHSEGKQELAILSTLANFWSQSFNTIREQLTLPHGYPSPS